MQRKEEAGPNVTGSFIFTFWLLSRHRPGRQSEKRDFGCCLVIGQAANQLGCCLVIGQAANKRRESKRVITHEGAATQTNHKREETKFSFRILL